MEETRMNGIELIAQERQEQIEKHGLITTRNVIDFREDQLLLAAFDLLSLAPGHTAPKGMSQEMWSQMRCKTERERAIIAGALIAANEDRLQMIEQINENMARRNMHKETTHQYISRLFAEGERPF